MYAHPNEHDQHDILIRVAIILDTITITMAPMICGVDLVNFAISSRDALTLNSILWAFCTCIVLSHQKIIS
jgi:hypothetical protein